MASTVGEVLASMLATAGATQVFGIVGDALNPFTDAIRRDKRMAWIGVRHEEGAALAAAGQAKLTGRWGVCAGTTGPGATHLLAGLSEASHDHAPVLAIAGDVPTNNAQRMAAIGRSVCSDSKADSHRRKWLSLRVPVLLASLTLSITRLAISRRPCAWVKAFCRCPMTLSFASSSRIKGSQ